MKAYKEKLLQIRQRLQGDVSAMADAALAISGGPNGGELSSIPSHLADQGSDTFEQQNTLRLMDNEEVVLTDIEAALERIEEGVYGSCVECSGRIPKMRLNVIPQTIHCVKCASELESNVRNI